MAQTNDVNSIQPDKVWYGEELYLQNIRHESENPTSIFYLPYESLNNFNVSYDWQKGDFRRIDQGNKANIYDFNIYGLKKTEKVSFEGSFDFSHNDYRYQVWNPTLFISDHNPFLTTDSLSTDSIPNNSDSETFHLNGGLAFRISDRLIAAIRADYRVGSMADQMDPRCLSKGSNIMFTPGIEWSASEFWKLGLAGKFGLMHESISYTANLHLEADNTMVLGFKSMGTFEGKSGSGFGRRYDGQLFGGTLQSILEHSDWKEISEIDFTYHSENAIDGTSSLYYGGDYNEMNAHLTNRLSLDRNNVIHNIGLDADFLLGMGTWHKQKQKREEGTGTLIWEIVSSEVVQQDLVLNADLNYRVDFRKNGYSHLSLGADAGFNMTNVTTYPDEYYVDFMKANAGIFATKRFIKGQTHYSIGLDGRYVMNLGELDYLLPMKTSADKRFQNGYTIPKWQYMSSDYVCGGIKAEVAFPLSESNGIWMKLGASGHYSQYMGDYARLVDTNRINAQGTLGLIF